MSKETEEYKKWYNKLITLNNYINALPESDLYTKSCQRDYNYMLTQDPRLKR